ncbi:MAG: signal peptidase I [Desulfobacterales bacterium]
MPVYPRIKKFIFPDFSVKLLIRVSLVGIAAFLLFSYVLIPFSVKGLSMEPTYADGSFNFCFRPVTLFSKPEKQDVVVIRLAGKKIMLLKRVVATENEIVEFRNGRLFVNGNMLLEPYVRYSSGWNLPPRQVKKNHVYVIGDNRGVSIEKHQFGQTPVNRIVGTPLW